MAKRKRGRIVGQHIDAGTWGENAQPGGTLFITEEGEKLTPDEAFRRAGVTEGRAMSPETEACLIAAMFFMDDVGIKDPRISARKLADQIGGYASELGLSGSENVGQHNSSFRAVLGRFLNEFRKRSAKR